MFHPNNVLLAAVIALLPSCVSAQTRTPLSTAGVQSPRGVTSDGSVGTPSGQEVSFTLGSYNYVEPGSLNISIHATKFGGEYTNTFRGSQHWFIQPNVRATFGNTAYDGWCRPWVIRPNSSSRNGYDLGVGEASPCSETGDEDWYIESRALIGRDFTGQKWTFSPYSGLGLRYLSNGTSGAAGYRTDTYLYPPIGVVAHTRAGSHGALRFNLEFDPLIRGWQTTRDSKFGSGDVPATRTTPAFSIDSFTDISFAQHGGWALRASTKYQMTRAWSVEPYYVHWRVSASPVNYETVTFTVNRITAQEQFGAYEPVNSTNEFWVKLGLHF